MANFEETLWDEDIYVPLGNKSRWESKQQYFNENDCRVEEHFIRDDQGRIQEIKLWKDTPSYPEETDEPDGCVYSKSYEYREDGSVKTIKVVAIPWVFSTSSAGYMQYDRLNRRVYLHGGRTHGEYFVLNLNYGEHTKPAYTVYLDTYSGGLIMKTNFIDDPIVIIKRESSFIREDIMSLPELYPITKSQKMNYDYAIRLSIAYNIAIDKSTIKEQREKRQEEYSQHGDALSPM